jgi:hypothetical protein
VDEVAPSERRAKRIYQEVGYHSSRCDTIDKSVSAPGCPHCRSQERTILPGSLQCQSVQLSRGEIPLPPSWPS